MRKYAQIGPQFWSTSKTGRAIRKKGAEAVVVAMYLMSSPHSNMLGLYYQPMLYMAHETGLGIEGADKGLRSCIEAGFCSFDEPSEMVWVHEMALYQIGDDLKANDKRCVGVQKEYDTLPDCPFLAPFFERYRAVFHMHRPRGGAAMPPYSPTVAPSLPPGSQEHEQDHEQDQDDDDAGASAHAGEGAREASGAPAPAPAPVADEPQWEGAPYDNPSTATKRGQWVRWFQGVGHQLDATCASTTTTLDRWVHDKVTIGEVTRAMDRAQERGRGCIGDLIAYIDTVIADRRAAAAQAAAKAPPEQRDRGDQHKAGAAVPSAEETKRAAAADAATKPDKHHLAEQARKAKAERDRIAAAKVAPTPAPAEGAEA